MQSYLDLLNKIMTKGVTVQTGATLTAVGRKPTARRLFGEQLRFDLGAGFPAVTTKPLFWRGVVAEWIWFMRGDPNVSWLRDTQNVHIWDQWADAEGYLGPVYGQQFRKFQGVKWAKRPPVQPCVEFRKLERDARLVSDNHSYREYVHCGYRYGVVRHDRVDGCMGEQEGPAYAVHRLGPYNEIVEVDQIGQARDDIRAVVADPFNRARRRIIVSLWNPAQVPDMALPPCHTFHAYDLVPPIEDDVDRRWALSLHLFARSIDAVKGLPFNIASYALMLHVMAAITGTRPRTLLITFNDVHIYDNQFEDVKEQLGRKPFFLPVLRLHRTSADTASISGFLDVCPDLTVDQAHRLEPSQFQLIGYRSHPRLKSESEVAV